MSLIPPGTAPYRDITTIYTSVQAAVTCAALYDHMLALGREVELVWMKPMSLITALYVIERYLGDVVLIAGLYLCLPGPESEEECVIVFKVISSDQITTFSQIDVCGFSGFVHGEHSFTPTMQLRVFALYRRATRILALLATAFLCEIAAIAFILWRTIGSRSPLEAVTIDVPGVHLCAFSGVDDDFVYLFIPFLCFEAFLFLLAARVYVDNMKRARQARDDKVFGENASFMSVLARDSLCYFFVNLVACAVVMGLWQGVTELYANTCVPFFMLLEVLVGTRLILDFRERYARPDDPVVSGRCSSLYFRTDDMQMISTRISVRCDIETIVVEDGPTVKDSD